VLSSPLNGYARRRRIVFIISRRADPAPGKEAKNIQTGNDSGEEKKEERTEEGRGWPISRERARKPAATPTSSSSPAMRGHPRVKRLPARGVDG